MKIKLLLDSTLVQISSSSVVLKSLWCDASNQDVKYNLPDGYNQDVEYNLPEAYNQDVEYIFLALHDVEDTLDV